MRSNMVVYLFFIFICTRIVLSSAGSNNPTLQQEVHGVEEALTGLNSNINEPDGSKYTLKEGEKGGRGGAHAGGGDADVDRSRHVPRNIVPSKRIVSFSVTFGSFFLLLFAV
ncbi:hypothetical protein HanRHA438_Chr09g0425861 [Helianthus annuus]|uniref:Transmembrane protein n=1 Tax=Helianthus annuus TaxID=4232 RepID=A0A251TZX2_HELAN|nr:uncharacterized protein LOC110875090 [Helianthus annuus]KAF5793102.1 hypothetical protein HanXRQr2_Chr09g0413641 [Helianthus annuus]KAJ0890620.1 hypothetical protein HanRHA438_Chr09g0425861 [Helianthus annuus]KAJ0895367.1 hypothetical protein HanPSC8_Chr09g0399741 [Helianthus annuus]